MSNKNTEKSAEKPKNTTKSAILGIGLALVMASILYSAALNFIAYGVMVLLLGLVPMLAFLAVVTFIAFSKIFK